MTLIQICNCRQLLGSCHFQGPLPFPHFPGPKSLGSRHLRGVAGDEVRGVQTFLLWRQAEQVRLYWQKLTQLDAWRKHHTEEISITNCIGGRPRPPSALRILYKDSQDSTQSCAHGYDLLQWKDKAQNQQWEKAHGVKSRDDQAWASWSPLQS